MRALLGGAALWVAASACAGQTGTGSLAPMGTTDGVPAPASAAAVLDSVVATPPFDRALWGALAVDAVTGEVLLERNAGRLFVPASNQKVLSTAAALARLGPDWRFETSLWAAGPVTGGVLRGDLVLPGSGDPTLSSRTWPSAVAALEALADSLAAAGVAEVDGTLIVDASAWDSTAVPGTWQVYDLPWRYAASGGAFAVAEGETEVVVRGGTAPGHGVGVSWGPIGEAGFLVPRLVTVAADSASDYRPVWHPETRRLVLEGEVAAGELDTLRLATRDPVRQAAAALHRVLEARGIAVRGGWRVAWEPGEPIAGGCRTGRLPACGAARRLATLVSPPLATIARQILEPSQNWVAEQLLLALGRHAPVDPGDGGEPGVDGGEGGDDNGVDGRRATREGGLEVVRSFLVDDVGIDSLDVELHDASGMSPYNLVTPRALVAVHRHLRASPHAAIWRDALASPGEEESTLENRLPELQGRLFAKTGTISPVVSLSGTLVRDDGREVVFALTVDNSAFSASRVRGAMDRVVLALARGR